MQRGVLGDCSVLPVVESSLPKVVRERASLQPNDIALTFYDYEQSWDGVELTLTWSQLYRRMLNLAAQIAQHGSTGDRVLLLAPQGLDYIVGFLASLHAGRVAVPLSVPQGGAHDERTTSVMADTSPAVVLTSSSVVDNVRPYVTPRPGQDDTAVLEVDQLDLDARPGPAARATYEQHLDPLYLQYTSGSTRTPAGVMLSNDNLFTNFEQIMSAFYGMHGKVAPPGSTIVSWLPFYHDLGFVLGIILPILGGIPAKLTSPMGFLQRPARWIQLLGSNTQAFTAAPNFAFDLAARKTKDEDLEGLDLTTIHGIVSGAERVQPVTVKRFIDRFSPFGLDPKVIRPSYGMAEATVFMASRRVAEPPKVVHFDATKLPEGKAVPVDAASDSTAPLVSYGVVDTQLVRIVDPDTGRECPDGVVGEIWGLGDNVSRGYWEKPDVSARTFGATIVNPSEGTPEGPWLRTGDSGFLSDGELYIVGRIKDLLIVYGRNHSPDDIEATIQTISPDRCAAIAVPMDGIEKLVAILEIRKKFDNPEEKTERLDYVKREVTSAISNSHGLAVADLVLAPQGSIPVTTSGKVRRALCVELYRQGKFARLDA
ncbi:putative fatty-acid--CoA ligase fadD25 [Mycobacterium kiyosense]|uniref:Fatty-acid--CoA ligase fadD25 n=1 Tax=Mycobacterium kiyosense TaxID=2871094 RepID=A0A9P3Q674_9MYCO|nr:putative fatty-acid--CoA ligase fadD25 [Mycobacterium sp. 20KCMC460]GLB83037.1 putative fatty-acid--CoA ligase fadD25 [Mycobacterium kiyosense]GLB94427.1 putative fatty-acid--CoA ligase fadD25 [Mycobacterium kiyosense]GLC00892.1 putative fatty-acid--CoA ligase fadD25 [Mycobacterium kiyosense]GLC08029.1 putative fatty-acid--CoA ligase fadD25 [Mycobacterium kiyosense]